MDLIMKTQKTFFPTLAVLALLITTLGLWSGAVQAQDQVQAQVQIYGSQLMTAAERTEYQTKMRALKTDKERDAFRLEHHDKMTVRAAEKGVTLPNSPPDAGAAPKGNSGVGVGPGSGVGKGQGSPANSPAGGGKGQGR
jgi:cell division protein FtsB